MEGFIVVFCADGSVRMLIVSKKRKERERNFSLENEGNFWFCDTSECGSTLQDVDWNIEGEWGSDWYGDWFGSFLVDLNINSISATDDPEIFSANLSCDANHRQGDFEHYCRTDGDTDAKLEYLGPGLYYLYIHDEGEYDSRWNGTFKLKARESSEGFLGGSEGFFWIYESFSNGVCELERR